MAIQVRRGKEDELDISKAVPGEWLVSTDTRYVRMCFAPGIVLRMATYEAFEADMAQIQAILEEAKTVEEAIQKIYDDVQQVVIDIETASNAAQTAIEKSEESKEFATAAASSASAAKTSETNAKKSASSASTSASTATKKATEASTYANNAKKSENTANTHATTASAKASEASTSANTASVKANDASDSALLAESYTHGGTGVRDNEDVDNAQYYKNQAERISQGLSGALLPMGTITFSQLANQTKQAGYMYNISNSFTTNNTFKEGAGYSYPEGTNVYYTADGYWDCIAGTSVVGVKGSAESSYRQGNVTITKDNLGMGDYGTADISKIADGTVKGGLSAVNENLGKKYSSVVASYKNNTDNPNTTTLPRIRTKHANCPTSDTEYDVFTMFTDGDVEANEKKQIAFGTGGSKEVYYRAKAHIGEWTEWEKLSLNSDLKKIKGGNLIVSGSGMSNTTTKNITVTFDEPLPDINYTVTFSVLGISAYYNNVRVHLTAKAHDSFQCAIFLDSAIDVSPYTYGIDWMLVPYTV